MVKQGIGEKYFQNIFRENQLYKKGADPNKKYNITFYGAGNIVKEAGEFLAGTNSTYLPIEKINFIGRKKESTTYNLERITEELNNSFDDNNIRVLWDFSEKLPEILPETDIFFFTADASDSNNMDRISMIKSNKPIVEEISKYFNQDFKGIINFTSNLPEILAHYAATKFDIPDVRQITAHIPLDMMRYEHLVKNKLLLDETHECLDLTIVGHHDSPYIVTKGSKMIKRFFIENGKEGIEEIDISEILENNKKLLQSTLNSYALNQFKIQEKELKAKNLSRREGPTTISTGKAIYNFIEAVINRKETTTGIPYQLNNKWFFVNLPVTFLKGYPELDYNKFKKLTEEDKEQLNMRIIGKGKRSLEKILNKTIKGKNLFEIPKDTEILDGIFNSSIRVILKNKIYSKQKDKEENNLSEKELTSKLSLEHYDKGIKFFDEKDYDNANISSRKALNLERKEKYWSLFSDSFFNSEKKNPQSLIHFLNYQESIDNSDSNLFHNKGLVFMSMKDYDNAIISYEKSLNLNPDSIWGHYDLGNCKIEIRDYHEAKKILLKGMAKDKEKKFEFLFRHKIGVSYYHQRLYDEAISNFKIEVGLNPESGWGFHDLALCYFELKNKPEFLYHANKALELKTVSKEWIDQKVKFLK